MQMNGQTRFFFLFFFFFTIFLFPFSFFIEFLVIKSLFCHLRRNFVNENLEKFVFNLAFLKNWLKLVILKFKKYRLEYFLRRFFNELSGKRKKKKKKSKMRKATKIFSVE